MAEHEIRTSCRRIRLLAAYLTSVYEKKTIIWQPKYFNVDSGTKKTKYDNMRFSLITALCISYRSAAESEGQHYIPVQSVICDRVSLVDDDKYRINS